MQALSRKQQLQQLRSSEGWALARTLHNHLVRLQALALAAEQQKQQQQQQQLQQAGAVAGRPQALTDDVSSSGTAVMYRRAVLQSSAGQHLEEAVQRQDDACRAWAAAVAAALRAAEGGEQGYSDARCLQESEALEQQVGVADMMMVLPLKLQNPETAKPETPKTRIQPSKQQQACTSKKRSSCMVCVGLCCQVLRLSAMSPIPVQIQITM